MKKSQMFALLIGFHFAAVHFANADSIAGADGDPTNAGSGGTYVSPISGTCITSPYGPRKIKYGNPWHTGEDFRAPIGTPVRAITSGTVITVSRNGVCGNYLEIRHDDGMYSHYCHCSKVLAKPGARVNPGDVVAKSGDSAAKGRPHLHLVVKPKPGFGDGNHKNPASYIRGIGRCG